MKKAILLMTVAALVSACKDDAQIATRNLTKAADNFEVTRRVIFYNAWQGEAVQQYVGKCSVEDDKTKFSVICKTGPSQFRRDIVGRNESMTYIVEQIKPIKASEYYYRRTFKPQSILPDFDFRGTKELPVSQ